MLRAPWYHPTLSEIVTYPLEELAGQIRAAGLVPGDHGEPEALREDCREPSPSAGAPLMPCRARPAGRRPMNAAVAIVDRCSARARLWLWGALQATRYGRPDAAFGFLGGLGDELLCSVPLVEWRLRGARRIWVMTTQPPLLEGLDPRARIMANDARVPRLCAALRRPFRYLSYSRYEAESDRDAPPERHIIAEMCRRAGLTGLVRLRPHFALTAAEVVRGRDWAGRVAIQTSTLTALVPMRNKQWPHARFQEVVDRLGPRFRFVQIGSADDPQLNGVDDLRGRTSLRETAAVLHHARAFVGPVGFGMHLARALECPSVIVYGGRRRRI